MEAFRLGRKLVADPNLLDLKNIVAEPEVLMAYGDKRITIRSLKERHAHSSMPIGNGGRSQYGAAISQMVEEAVGRMGFDDETNKHLARRLYDLILWMDLAMRRNI